MAEGRSRDAWGHTSALMALLANVHRDPKKTRPYKPAHFNPHLAPRSGSGRRERVSVDQLTREILAIAESKQRKGR